MDISTTKKISLHLRNLLQVARKRLGYVFLNSHNNLTIFIIDFRSSTLLPLTISTSCQKN